MKIKRIILILSVLALVVFTFTGVLYAKDNSGKILTIEEVKAIKGEKDGYDIPATIDSDNASKEEKAKLEKEADEKIKANPDLIKSDKDIPATNLSEKESKAEKDKLKAEADKLFANKKYEGTDIAPTEASIKKDKEERERLEAEAIAIIAVKAFEDAPYDEEKVKKADEDEKAELLKNKSEKTHENDRTDVKKLESNLQKKIEDDRAYALANNRITEFKEDKSPEALAKAALKAEEKKQAALDKIASMKYVDTTSEEVLQQLKDAFEARHAQEIQDTIDRLNAE